MSGASTVRQHLGKDDVVGTVALCLEAAEPGRHFVDGHRDDRKIRLGHGLVEPHQHVASLDAIAFTHVELTDDPARRMLDLLDAAVDDDLALRDDGAGKPGRGGPDRRRRR